MDEKAAVEEGVRSRLSLIRHLSERGWGTMLLLDVMGLADSRIGVVSHLTEAQLQVASSLREIWTEELVRSPVLVAPEDVCETLAEVWEAYPSATAYATDVLVPSGMIFFAKPLQDPDEKVPIPLEGFVWIVIPSDDERVSAFRKDQPPGSFMLMLLGLSRASSLGLGTEKYPRLLPVSSVLWTIGLEGGGHFWGDDEDPVMATNQRTPYVKMLLTYFRILSQGLLEEDGKPKELDKRTPTRIKSARKLHPNLNGKIHVTRFRMETGSGDKTKERKPSGREYSVRFYRRPYWRWQFFPSTGERKPKLIITKKLIGPEGAPIVGGNRVFLPPKPIGPRPERKQ
jgi:hypothetical protein